MLWSRELTEVVSDVSVQSHTIRRRRKKNPDSGGGNEIALGASTLPDKWGIKDEAGSICHFQLCQMLLLFSLPFFYLYLCPLLWRSGSVIVLSLGRIRWIPFAWRRLEKCCPYEVLMSRSDFSSIDSNQHFFRFLNLSLHPYTPHSECNRVIRCDCFI